MLTDDEIDAAYKAAGNQELRPQDKHIAYGFARAIIAAHTAKLVDMEPVAYGIETLSSDYPMQLHIKYPQTWVDAGMRTEFIQPLYTATQMAAVRAFPNRWALGSGDEKQTDAAIDVARTQQEQKQ